MNIFNVCIQCSTNGPSLFLCRNKNHLFWAQPPNFSSIKCCSYGQFFHPIDNTSPALHITSTCHWVVPLLPPLGCVCDGTETYLGKAHYKIKKIQKYLRAACDKLYKPIYSQQYLKAFKSDMKHLVYKAKISGPPGGQKIPICEPLLQHNPPLNLDTTLLSKII